MTDIRSTAAPFSGLLRTQGFIGGAWRGSDDGGTFAVVNPATGAVLGQVPAMGAAETTQAVAAARSAFPGWRATLAKDRSRLLRRWFDLIMANQEALARLLTAEQGKPLAEARVEIAAGAANIEWFAEEAKRLYGDIIPAHKDNVRCLVTKEPVGVVAAITPWNFPNSMITRKLAPALAAGCTVVLKPAEDTPLSALALVALAEEAGFPAGAINVVTAPLENAPAVGRALTDSADVRKLSFTGSTEIGRLLMAQSAATVKKVSLELGGNAPFIVFDSADLDAAVDGAMRSKFRNAGQTCVTANRLYVQSGVYDAFTERLATRVRDLKIGAGDAEGVQIGPLINRQGIDKVAAHVRDALARGACLVCGGGLDAAGPLFYQPTLLRDMTPAMVVKSEETFGPVAALFRFGDEAELVREANDTIFGLASFLYTGDMAQAFRVSGALEYGMVAVNDVAFGAESVPFGGMKQSGLGRELSKYGIEEFVEVKYTMIGGI